MRQMFSRLWKDEDGIIALEYLLLATIVGLGLITGLASLRQALVTELVELAAAITTINQGYSYEGFSVCVNATTSGSATTDVNATINYATVVPVSRDVSVLFCSTTTGVVAP